MYSSISSGRSSVVIGDQKVIAMGTSFVVRREQPTGSAFAVTSWSKAGGDRTHFMAGRIAERASSGIEAAESRASGCNSRTMRPRREIRLSIERVTAWQRGS